MDSLKFDRKVLLKAVRDNRDKHQTDYDEAVEGYKEAVVEALQKKIAFFQKALADYKNGGELHPGASLGLTPPRHYMKDYNRVVKMLEMSHEDDIELSHEEFSQYVMDDWKWKENFTQSTALYSNNKLWKSES